MRDRLACMDCVCVMMRRPPRSTRSSPLCPSTTLCRAKNPFWVRCKAWWEGSDLANRPKQKIPLEMGELSQDAVRYDAPEPRSMRLEVMQQIWGKGMSGPGDEEYILRLEIGRASCGKRGCQNV